MCTTTLYSSCVINKPEATDSTECRSVLVEGVTHRQIRRRRRIVSRFQIQFVLHRTNSSSLSFPVLCMWVCVTHKKKYRAISNQATSHRNPCFINRIDVTETRKGEMKDGRLRFEPDFIDKVNRRCQTFDISGGIDWSRCPIE